MSVRSATPWAAGTNDTIDATNNAYWSPALNANGTLGAFDVVAKDDAGTESVGTVTADIDVTPVNDVPTLSSFAGVVETRSFAELAVVQLKVLGINTRNFVPDPMIHIALVQVESR